MGHTESILGIFQNSPFIIYYRIFFLAFINADGYFKTGSNITSFEL